MKAEALSYFHLPMLTLIGLGIFVSYFMLMLLWVYRRQGVPMYQHLANMPLGED